MIARAELLRQELVVRQLLFMSSRVAAYSTAKRPRRRFAMTIQAADPFLECTLRLCVALLAEYSAMKEYV
jgi:hypothetical protein